MLWEMDLENIIDIMYGGLQLSEYSKSVVFSLKMSLSFTEQKALEGMSSPWHERKGGQFELPYKHCQLEASTCYSQNTLMAIINVNKWRQMFTKI